MALNYETCATAIINSLTSGYDIPQSVKANMIVTWKKIIQQLFSHIVNNMQINVSIPDIPLGSFSATVTVGGTPYAVTFNNDIPIPDESVSIS